MVKSHRKTSRKRTFLADFLGQTFWHYMNVCLENHLILANTLVLWGKIYHSKNNTYVFVEILYFDTHWPNFTSIYWCNFAMVFVGQAITPLSA